MPRSRMAAAVWFLGLVAVGMQAAALAAQYFQPGLSADYIYPQLFVEDVLGTSYPLAGWTLSSSPGFFPDLAVAAVLRALAGSGPVLPAYLVFAYVALAVLTGWSLARVTGAGWSAWLGGVALVNALLVWRPVTDHAHYLWLLGALDFHSGAILSGLACMGLWAGDEGTRLTRGSRILAVVLFFLGAISDTLFLTQAVLPLGVGLWIQAGWNWRRPRVRDYILALGAALALVAVVRLGLAGAGWFQFSRVVRYAPLPAAVGRATTNFVRDLLATLVPGAWGLLALAAASLVGVGFLWWREFRRGQPLPPLLKPAVGFALVGLAATTLLPLVTAYWRDPNHVRYILPWLVLPGWLALAWVIPRIRRWSGTVPALAAGGLVFVGLTVVAWPQIRRSALVWPYSSQQARIDEFLTRRDLRRGFSDYWHAHEINTLSHAPVRLFALRPNAVASLWNNNAFAFFEHEAGNRSLHTPRYSFIIVDGLEPAALRKRFGEPDEQAEAGGLTFWIYAGIRAERLTAPVDAEVRDFLRGRPGESRID